MAVRRVRTRISNRHETLTGGARMKVSHQGTARDVPLQSVWCLNCKSGEQDAFVVVSRCCFWEWLYPSS